MFKGNGKINIERQRILEDLPELELFEWLNFEQQCQYYQVDFAFGYQGDFAIERFHEPDFEHQVSSEGSLVASD